MSTNNVIIEIDCIDLDSIDSAISLLLCKPRIKKRIYERIRYNISSPGKVFYEALDSMICDVHVASDVTRLLRDISQLEHEVSYLSHQLVNYDSLVNKYDKLAVKVDFLKRQNKRLLERNEHLLKNVHKPKNNRQ